MHKILLIDKGGSSVHKFSGSLAKKGYTLIHETTIKKALPRLKDNSISLIMISNSFPLKAAESNGFKKLATVIPKIILIEEGSRGNDSLWTNDALAVPVHGPVTLKETVFWIKRMLKTKELEDNDRALQAKNRELCFFNDITKTVNSAPDLKKGLLSIMDKAKSITQAGAWSLILNDEPIFEIIPLRPSKKIQKFVFDRNIGISSRVMHEGVPLNIDDVSRDRRFNKKADNVSNLKTRSMLCVPLKIRERVVGVLRLVNKKGGVPFTDNDVNLAMNTAGLAAMSIEQAFLYQKTKYDELTNLYNASYLREAVDMEIQRAERYGSLFSIIFMDVDDFKKVNDRFGHLVGSRVLIEIARILQKNLRKIDIITRYGGDEYVIILPQTSREISVTVAERMRKTIEKNIFLDQAGYNITLTASFGVASYPDNAKSKEELLNIADNAMYHGKFLTKNIVYTAK